MRTSEYPRLILATLVIWIGLALGLEATASGATEHPTLIKVESTQCNLCHEEILLDKPNVHSPVADDCTLCHEFSKGDEGTTVELVESEPALCVMCHSELEAAVAMELEAPHMAVEDSCLLCHDPHASAQEKLKLATTAELCSNCHDVDELDQAHGGQLTEATRCGSCHNPHGSDNARLLVASSLHAPFEEGSCTACHREPFGTRIRLRARGQRLCTSCHGDFPEPEGGSVHAALEDERGRAACLSCHDPHMSAQPAMLLEEGPTVCASCHAEIVEAALAETGHYVAAEDCANCHEPHTATEAKLLTVPAEELCSMCHDVEDEELTASHLGAELGSLICTQCHSPHGAGHPKLLAENLHAVVEDGCDICHEGGYNELMEGGSSELCLMCHDDIGEAAQAAAVSHDAMEMDDCTLCHNPHASAQAKLIKLPSGGACGECHDDQMAGPDEVAHGVIDLIGCEACHEPHGGEQERLLRKAGSELCLACHGTGVNKLPQGAETATWLEHFTIAAEQALQTKTLRLSADGQHNHPVDRHRTLGTPSAAELGNTEAVFEGELTCMTCHNPHKGRSRGLFNWGAASPMEACQHCHKK